MDSLEAPILLPNEQENELLEQRINKVTKELQSYNHEDGHGASTGTPSTDTIPTKAKVYDESSIRYFEAISKLTEEQGEQLSILTEQARRLVAENEELRRKTHLMGRASYHNKSNNDDHLGLKSGAVNNTLLTNKDQQLPQDPSLLSEENACLTEQLVLMTKEVEHQKNLLQSREQTIKTLNEQLSNFGNLHSKLQTQIHQLHQDKSLCEEQLVKKISNVQLSEESLQKVQIELSGFRARYSELEERSKDLMCEKEDLQIEAEQLSAKASSCINHVLAFHLQIFPDHIPTKHLT